MSKQEQAMRSSRANECPTDIFYKKYQGNPSGCAIFNKERRLVRRFLLNHVQRGYSNPGFEPLVGENECQRSLNLTWRKGAHHASGGN